jgi:UDP-N-acetyl-D-glucosamine/UDP-N-acetyl-D-galactosamine dehydrogenase
MIEKLKNKESSLALIGLGYVGLPIALEFAKSLNVIGFDISQERVDLMRQGIDPSGELGKDAFKGADITFTAELADLRNATFFIVAVPTPINDFNLPELKPLKSASKTVGSVIKKGDIVVFESTVYPGATEEDCVPILEKESGLKWKIDFNVGYSPERINPGDTKHTLVDIVKVTSGDTNESAEIIDRVYNMIVKAGTHRAPSIKVAEAAKVIENTQRDLNISLMNELSVIFGRLGINTYDVLEAAGTKWNFLNFAPGLVGGHCIGVDPYYLTYKAQQVGYIPQVILAGRLINDNMGRYIAKNVIKSLIKKGKVIKNSKVLIMGITFKENVEDIRNSKVVDIVKELEDYGVDFEVVDPYAKSEHVEKEYGIKLSTDGLKDKYDAIVLAVSHDDYKNMKPEAMQNLLKDNGLLFDLKGLFRAHASSFDYWSL